MPLYLRDTLNRIPLLSLRYYTLLSSSLLIGVLLYHQDHFTQLKVDDPTDLRGLTRDTLINGSITSSCINTNPFLLDSLRLLVSMIASRSLAFLIFLHTIYCYVVLLGRQLQLWVFGELRPVELQRLKDRLWNYAFYKFCFIFGVLGVENFDEILLWISWFFLLAFALLFSQLAKDRFELSLISVSIPRQSPLRIPYLLLGLLGLCTLFFTICFLVGLEYGGVSLFFFMLAETILLTLDIGYLLFKYLLVRHQQRSNHLQASSESYSSTMYYIEFLFDILTLTIDIIRHLQMLFYHQAFMSMSSVIFFMQLKPLFIELIQRLKRHQSYCVAMQRVTKKYPLLTKYDLVEKSRQQHSTSIVEELCSICWEKFENARCLPCGHLFHQNCLRSWFEQDVACPICRLSLHDDALLIQSRSNSAQSPSVTLNNRHRRSSLWLFHLAMRIHSSFLLRFVRTRLIGGHMTSMALSVHQVFPHIPFEIILSDLQRTQSVQMTMQNIIQQRIHFVQHQDVLEGEQSLETDLADTNNSEKCPTWPLDSSLPFATRKQHLISYMRQRYLERERCLQ